MHCKVTTIIQHLNCLRTCISKVSNMASSSTTVIQSFFGSPAFTSINKPSIALKRNIQFRVRSMANKDGGKEQVAGTPVSIPSKPKVSTDFFDLLAFSGPAPERINGRLAMIGFVTAIGVELANGQDVFTQLQNGGASWFLYTTALLSVASLVPLFQGVRAESKSGQVMTSDAELLNGRFAMLGLVALALTEFVKGSALV